MTRAHLTGLVAAAHTPFHADGSLNLSMIEAQAAHLAAHGIRLVFIGGTTGEWSSLTLEERCQLTAHWLEVSRGTLLKVVVHVGANCLADARVLAEQAQKLGALAISALAPSYFKPRDVGTLVEFMAEVASAAAETPFYYYEIPSLTAVTLPASEFLNRAADRIPNLAEIKFTSSNLMEYQICLAARGGAFDIAFGFDEMLLAGLALGAKAAVGSTYNFAAPIYHRLMRAFAAGDLKTAQAEQLRSVRLVEVLASRGFMGAAKATMRMIGVEVGPARLPNSSLSVEQQTALRGELERMGFFDWIAQPGAEPLRKTGEGILA